jgi:hypothetical protein
MTFECFYRDDVWEFQLNLLRTHEFYYDAILSARGYSYHMIVGTHAYGAFLCIPNFNIGCEISTFDDVFWNCERISQLLDIQDATYLALAIKHLEQL